MNVSLRSTKMKKQNRIIKNSVKMMYQLAKERGGKCLSNKYISAKAKLDWQCKNGHKWSATIGNIRNNGTWCPECFGSKKLTIEEMQILGESKGGKLLSTEYINRTQKLKWSCSHNHIFEASPSNIKTAGTWCPECARQRKVTIEKIRTLAETKGGKCLSDNFISSKTKLDWQCKNGHTWSAVIGSIRNNGSWCPECVGKKKLTIEGMRVLAESKGGRLLSTEYIIASYKLKWQCSVGHIFEARPSSVKNLGAWCSECVTRSKYTIEEIRTLAESRGGKCLSDKYINSGTKLDWECKNGHKWRAILGNVKHNGSWCRECAKKNSRLKDPNSSRPAKNLEGINIEN